MTIDNRQPTLALNYQLQHIGSYPSSNFAADMWLGAIRTYGHNFNTDLDANGAVLPISTNTALFTLLGTTFGGDGRTTFEIPDLEGRVIVGSGTGAGLTTRPAGQDGGADSVTLVTANKPATSGGAGQALSNTEEFTVVNYAINVGGDFNPDDDDEHGFLGEIIPFAGSKNQIPSDWMLAEGQLLSISANSALFSKIGTTYGGDGTTTFALPDLRGRAIVGAGDGPGLNNVALGAEFGSETITLTDSNLPAANGGASAPIDNYQPSLGLHYLVALQGTFPSWGVSSDTYVDLGEIIAYAGADVPLDFAHADGQLLAISSNQALFSLYGTMYGGDGRTTFALPDLRGRSIIDADFANPQGSKSGAQTIVLTDADIPAIAPPVITSMSQDTGASSTDGITSDNAFTISGTSEPNATVYVFQGDVTEIASVTANSSGIWSLDLSTVLVAGVSVTPLDDGTYSFTATAGFSGTARSAASAEFNVEVDAIDPTAPVITGVTEDTDIAADGITSDPTLVFHGTGEEGTTVALSLDGNPIGTALVAPNGLWSFDYTGTSLAVAEYAVTAVATDVAGNTSPTSATFTLDRVNAAPTATGIPARLTAVEDQTTDVDLSAVSFADLDGDTLTVTLTVSAGTIAAASGVVGVTVAASGTAAPTLTGSAAALTTYLDTAANLTFAPPLNLAGDGAATLTINVNDTKVALDLGVVELDITAVNDDPTAAGLPTAIAVSEDVTTNFNLSAVTLADVDSAGDLTLVLAAGEGTFIGLIASGITPALSNANKTITLVGTATELNAYLDVAANVTYTPALNDTGMPGDTVAVTLADEDGSGAVALPSIAVNITALNDVPTAAGLPASISLTEDVAGNFDLSAATLGDVDSTGDLTVVLTATSGTFAGVTAGGVAPALSNGDKTITLVGTVGELNAYIATASNITYTGASNANGTGADTVAVSIADADGSGAVALPSIAVNLAAVNDAPTAAGLPTTIAVVEDMTTNFDLSAATLADVDSSGDLTLTLTAGEGTFTGTTTTAVTPVVGSGGKAITLVGTAAELNAYLDVAANLRFTPAQDDTGTPGDTVAVTLADVDGSGAVTLPAIAVNISAENDIPTAAGVPAAVSVTEDVAGSFDLSGITLADVDSAGDLTLVLTAGEGTFAGVTAGGVTPALSNGAKTITLVGTVGELNGYLGTAAHITYTGAANDTGTPGDSVAVTLADADGSGAVALPQIAVNIAPVNDAPMAAGLPTTLRVGENTTSEFNLSAMTVADVDSAGDLTLVLSAADGTFTGVTASGVSPALTNGGKIMTLVGTAAELNAYLGVAANIKYTPALNDAGTPGDFVNVTLADTDGSGATPLGQIGVNITDVNNAPTAASVPATITVTEETPGAFDLSAVTIGDVDSPGDLTLVLTATDGSFAGMTAGGVTPSVTSGGKVITLVGTVAELNAYLSTASNITYTGAANDAGMPGDSVAMTLADGDGSGVVAVATIAVNITNVNDAPTAVNLPATVTVTEDVAGHFDLSSVVIADVDSAGDLQLVLSAGEGSLAGIAASGIAPVVSNGGKTITLVGTVGELNGYLSTATNLTYTGAQNDNGMPGDSIAVTIADGDGSGVIALPSFAVNIGAVNDVPTAAGIPNDLTVTEDVATAIDLSAITLTDVEGGVLTVTLAASAGVLTATSDSGVVVAGSGTGTVTLTGAVAAIDSYLNLSTRVVYTGAANATGDNAATLAISANDGAGDTPLGVVNLDITAVNDAPTAVGLPASLTVSEDTLSNLDLSAVDLGDVEDIASLTVTLAVDAGKLSVNAPAGVFSVVTGAGKTLTLSGTVSALNSAMNAADLVQYIAPANAFGNGLTNLAITLNDNAGSGAVAVPSVPINVLSVNDAPTVDGLPARIDAVEDVALGLDLASIMIADVDAGATTTVTVSTVSGTLTAAAGTGVTATLATGGMSVSLVGGLTDLNAYLGTAGNLGFTGAENANGTAADTITLQVEDGAGGLVSQDILVDIEAVVDVTTTVVIPGSGPVVGGPESDRIFTSSGNDSVDGGDGDDIIVDTGGDDIVRGGAGNDGIAFLNGTNEGFGGLGDDVLIGGIDGDFLSGGEGNDILIGDMSARIGGRDQLNGGTGNDLLTGSVGVDSFVFKPNDGNDTIAVLDIDVETPANTSLSGADFSSGIDRIVLEGFGYLDPDAAFAKVSDVGGIATFADQGTTITFFGLTSDDLSADDFFIL